MQTMFTLPPLKSKLRMDTIVPPCIRLICTTRYSANRKSHKQKVDLYTHYARSSPSKEDRKSRRRQESRNKTKFTGELKVCQNLQKINSSPRVSEYGGVPQLSGMHINSFACSELGHSTLQLKVSLETYWLSVA